MRDLQQQIDRLNTESTIGENYHLLMVNTIIELSERVLHLENKIEKLTELLEETNEQP